MKYVSDPQRKQSPKLKFTIGKLHLRWQLILQWLLWILAIGFAVIAITFIVFSKDLPNPNQLLERDVPQSTKIYARDNSLLYEIHGEVKRTLIPSSDINDNVKYATISIEDKDFYNEGALDFKSIARSAITDIFHLGASQGASTITQQFVKNAILTSAKTPSRKIKEAILSIEINETYSKDDILKLYLNEIPYGENAYGIEAAAETYFGIHAKDLDLAQAAYLAALPQSPSYLNPNGLHRDALDARKNLILSKMLEYGHITQDQYNGAKAETVTFSKIKDPIVAPFFVTYIEDYLTQKYGETTLETGGLKVITTLDPKMQADAEKAVSDGVAVDIKKYNGNNGALVAIDPKTGQILAMVGSKDFFGDPTPTGCKEGVNCTFDPEVNVALAQRQPGSSAKPYVYATAFKPQFKESPATERMDVVTDFGSFGGKDYIPKNYNLEEYGPVSIRQALAGSLNIDAVKTLAIVGVPAATQTMRDFGITSPLQNCGLSLVLGGCEVTLLDHVSGYSTIATEGIHHQETGILEIDDANGNVLEKFQDNPQEVLDPQAAYELINIMTDNNARGFVFGTHSALAFSDRTVAAKTGTTQNFNDGWTLGFTPSLAAGVWVGNNDHTPLKSGADGVVVAAPIFHAFMEAALQGTPDEQFTVPAGITHVNVDTVSGLLPNPYTPTTKNEVFASYSVPTTYDTIHQVYAVPVPTALPTPTDTLTPDTLESTDPNSLSTSTNPTTPVTTATVNQLFEIYHSEMPDNPNWENPVQAWAIAHNHPYPPAGAVQVEPAQAPPITTGGTGTTSQ